MTIGLDNDHLINPALLQMTKQAGIGGFSKHAFVPGGDPSMGGAPPGGDPAAGGGGPPPGGDPSGGGGGGGPPPGDPRVDQIVQQMQQMQQQMMAGGGGAGGAGGAKGLTPKIDEKAVMLQILKILARIADQLGIKIPASEMVVNQQDMMGLAQASSSGGPLPGMDQSQGGGGGAGGGGAIGGMPPMDPMQGAGMPGGEKAGGYRPNGTAFDTSSLTQLSNKAAAIGRLRKQAA